MIHMGHAHMFFPGLFFLYGLSRLFWLLLLGVLVWALIRMIMRRNQMRQYPQYPPRPDVPPFQRAQQPEAASAMEILRQRYARGEIDATTFDQMRERLEASYGNEGPLS